MSRVDAKTNSLTKGLTQNLFKIPFTRDKSIKFDGTDDVITTSADSTLATKTYSFWAKSTDTGGNVIFDHGGAFSGALQFHYGSSHILWMNGGYVFWPKTPESSDGNWHHHLFVVNTVYANSKWYQDGVLQAQTSNSAHGASSTSYSTGIRIGRGGSAYFDGSLDEFAIFDGDQSALADELYNNGRPTNLLQYSTLDHWYRMGEGKLGTKSDGESNLLFQGITESLGSELTIANPYASSQWTTYGNIVSNPSTNSIRVARGASGGSNSALQASLASGGILTGNVTVGKTYKLTFDFETDETSGSIALARFYDGSSYTTLQTGSGSVEYYFTAANAGLALGAIELSPNQYVQFSNISLKEVNGQFVGNELITNTDFSSSSGWNLDTNASVSGGKLVLASSTGISYQNVDLDNGAAYEVIFTVENLSSGTVKPYLNGTNGTVRNANGTYKEIVLAGSSNNLVGINPSGSMHIDNFSIKKLTNVGTISGAAIQADGGTELVTNGTFDTDSDWTKSSPTGDPPSTATISGGSANFSINGGDYIFMNQSVSFVDGSIYQLTATVNGTAGKVMRFMDSGANNGGLTTSNGAVTMTGSAQEVSVTFTANSNSSTIIIARQSNSGDYSFTVDNVSVKEVTESVPKKTQNLPSAGSAKSMAFDATDEFVDTGFQPDFIHTDATISFWCNMANFSGFQALGCYSSGKQFYVGFNGTAAGFALQATGKSSTDISAHITAGLWHHIALVADGGTATYYVDGVARDTHSYTPAASANPDTNFYIGAIPDGSGGRTYHMEGSVSEVAVWDAALDGDAIRALYNAGLPTPVTTKTGAYDIYRDNLKAYYKMGDATIPAQDGTSNLLFDQTSPGVGSELITNGTFNSNVTSWPASSSGTVTWSNGTAITGAVGTDDRGGMSQTFTTVNGAVYQLSFDVVSRTSTKWEVYRQGTGPGTIIEGTDLGSHSTFFTAAATSTELAFYAKQAGTSDGTVAWDNISVKQVNGHTGTISGATIQTEAPKQIYALPPVANTKSLNFDGIDDYLDLGASSTFFSTNVNTISFWFKIGDTAAAPTGSGEERIFVSNSDAGGSDLRVRVATSGKVSVDFWNGSGLSSTAGGPVVDDSEWHHLVFTTTASAQALYVDGALAATTTHTRASRAGSVSATVAAHVTSAVYANMSADELGIWGVALSAENVRALYNRGRPIDISSGHGAYDQGANLLHWWRMGDATNDGTGNLIYDQVGSKNATMTNMDAGSDIQTDTPY